jgi:hypothetical protein
MQELGDLYYRSLLGSQHGELKIPLVPAPPGELRREPFPQTLQLQRTGPARPAPVPRAALNRRNMRCRMAG